MKTILTIPKFDIDIFQGIPGNPGPIGPQPDIQPFIQQLQLSTGVDKGPTPFTYMQATVGPPGPRGTPGWQKVYFCSNKLWLGS